MLSKVLLGSVPESLWEGVVRLIIVPDGFLYYLPFEILPLSPGDDYLGDRYLLAYTPSATALQTLQRFWKGGEHKADFVGFGDPAFVSEADGDAAMNAATRFRFAGVELKRLKGSGEEVREIAEAFGERGSAYLREQATEYRAMRRSEGARFVHFATHGLIDDERPLYSGLALAPPEEEELTKVPHLDDMLQAYEMFSLRLTAEAVVCSTCQSGLGKLHEGEGMVGMTRALFFAGARCVVVSLWPVDDRATSELMQAFYRAIREGRSVAEALMRARTEIRERWPDLRDWAAFVVVGLGW
jgi:CHAT domain-containing protein